MIDVLFVSNLMSKTRYEELYSIRNEKRVEPSQKFFNLFINGLLSQDINVTCISVRPVNHSNYNKLFLNKEIENINEKLTFNYVGFINFPIIKYVSVYRSVKKAVKLWIEKSSNKDKVIIVDPMLIESTHIAIKLAKKYNVKICSFVTDVPSLTFNKSGPLAFLKNMYLNMSDKDICNFDLYILLTEQMNELFNKSTKPNIVVECFVPFTDNFDSNIVNKNSTDIIFMYAGKLDEKFGIINLVDSFKYVKNNNVKLHLYGVGDSVNYIKEVSSRDSRISYLGVKKVEEIETIIKNVNFLINPRPTSEIFTKYSFPSKTAEYLCSGTPFLTTNLAGIPKDYYPYLNIIYDYTAIGIAKQIEELISINYDILKQKAVLGKEFIIKNKNSQYQAKKIYNFLVENL